MHLELMRKRKLDDAEVGESKAGLDYKIVSKILCSLEGGYAYFKGSLTKKPRNSGQGLLKVETDLSLKKLEAWV